MKGRSGEKIKLTSIDELLGVVNEESAMEIEINRIHAFKDHPFKVLDDEKMADLVESVKTVSYTHLDVYKRQAQRCPFREIKIIRGK